MSKLTLLEITQDILSDMDSDEVNSINDTIESLQVAQMVKTTYYNIIDGKDWPWLKEMFALTGLGLTTKPSHMQIPEAIIDVLWIKYNVRSLTDIKDSYRKIKYKAPEEFISITDARNSSLANVETITDYGGTPLYIVNDAPPTYYTSFDDNYVVFDSYDSDVDDSMQTSKVKCFGKRNPTFTLSDNFTPDLPVQMFSYLLNEAKATAFLTAKQMVNQKAEQHSITQRRRMSQEAWKVSNGITYPSYGRK